MKRYRIGVIGLGSMGSGYARVLAASPRWDLAWACDLRAERLEWVKGLNSGIKTTQDADELLRDPSLDVVGIFTLADVRPRILRAALQAGKHVIAEKPIAGTVAEEEALLDTIEASPRLVAVNLFNRNAWYHHEIQAFIREGEIGDVAVISVSHQTAGLMPTEGHAPEGPPFHDCGMHYVDVARWYADSEYDRWNAQGVRMWGWKDPWWVNAHGSFRNGVVFSITQGFCYGQLAQTKVCNCGLEVIGTLGVVRMRHDFRTVTIEYHGVNRTATKAGPYGGKKLDVMCGKFADSLDAGRNVGFPTAADSVIASRISQAMLDDATRNAAPVVGTPEEMERILSHRRSRNPPS